MYKQRGSSLLEILITMVVLAICLTSLTVFQTSVASSDSLAEQRTEASHLAQKKIEQLRDLRNSADYKALASSQGSKVVGSGRNTEYKLSWVVKDSGTAEDYRTLEVKVTWKDKQGEVQAVNLSTIVGKDAPLRVAALANPARNTATNNGKCTGEGDASDDDGTDDGTDDDGLDDDLVNDDLVDDDFGSDDGVDDDVIDDDLVSDDGVDDDGAGGCDPEKEHHKGDKDHKDHGDDEDHEDHKDHGDEEDR